MLQVTELFWFALCILVGLNVGFWGALLFRSSNPMSSRKLLVCRTVAIAMTLGLLTAIGKLRPAGEDRGNDGAFGAVAIIAAWGVSYWALKAVLRRRRGA
jgi:hypothetical protein